MMRAIDLISPAYLQEQKVLHASPRGYGERGRKWADTVLALAKTHDAGSILDYGCGQGSLVKALRGQTSARLDEYDPAIPGKESLPSFADLVVCTDVMEHVEGACLPSVIAHLSVLTRRVLFLVISLVPTAKTLTNGDQAHISLYPVAYWREAFELDFELIDEFDIKADKQWAAVLRPRIR